jgi:hypothetical protein
MNISEAKFKIFISYSHRDAEFVKLMVEFLRPAGARVFWDEDNIRLGKKWAVVITTAIRGCRLMYLFWCSHSSTSQEVKKEYEAAVSLEKDIVPILLDNTPLPERLKQFQWLDFRDITGRQHNVIPDQAGSKVSHPEGLVNAYTLGSQRRRKAKNKNMRQGHLRQLRAPKLARFSRARNSLYKIQITKYIHQSKKTKYVRQILDLQQTRNVVRRGAALWSRNLEQHIMFAR